MRVTAFYDRSKNELALDKELDDLVGERHQHAGIHIPTMKRDVTWEFEHRGEATEARDRLLKHAQVQEVVFS